MTINTSSVDSEEIEMTNGDQVEDEEAEEENILFAKQKELLHSDVNDKLVVGQSWYMLDKHWYKQLKKYIEIGADNVDPESENPGPIDNTPLFETASQNVREHLLEGSEFKLINKRGWKRLLTQFGLAEGQEPLQRTVIEHGIFRKEAKVEIYPLRLQICLFKNLENEIVKMISKTTTLDIVVKIMKEGLGIPEDEEVRLWSKFMQNTYELLLINQAKPTTLQDHGINSGQTLVLEQKNEENKWPRQTRTRSVSGSSSSAMNVTNSPSESSFSSASNYSSYSSYQRQHSTTYKPGLCGLSNLGNTCFMNSALQCLSNTTPLMKYFLANTHKSELNPTNPLGMNGKVAEGYADLMHQMWSGNQSHVSPRQFKMTVGRFAPRFSGYQQQDSQELLAFLLDGLHEDLNRVKQKPYIEIPDDKGRADEVLAQEAWTNHSKRNDSVITDNFHGLFKSTVECPECGKRSITFDPFCYLSLPLPIKRERTLKITFVPIDHSKRPIQMKVTIPKLGQTIALCEAVSKLTGVEPDKMIITDVFNSKFHKRFTRNESLSQITDKDDIFVYEIPVRIKEIDESNLAVVPIYMKTVVARSTYSSYPSTSLFWRPMLVVVPKKAANADDVYHIIIKAMRRFVKVPKVEVKEEVNEVESDEKEVNQHQEVDGDGPTPPLEKDQDEADVAMKDDSEDDFFSADEEPEKHEGETNSNGPVPKRLFELKFTNYSGSQDQQTLDYESPTLLDVHSRSYMCAEWYPKLKEKYFDEQTADEKEEHPTYREVPLIKKNSIQLEDCLELFLQREKLGEQDPWYCPECKEHRQAFKKFDLWSLPKVLVIHLKRFSYNKYWRDKLDALVHFPVKGLELTNYVIDKKHPRSVYDLHAVSNHYGGMGGGHYTAYGINCYDGQWHYFDDSSVSLADEHSPVSKAAYLLFYTRRDDPDSEMMNTSDLLTEDNTFMDD
uniref:Ubiquitin carboxyl-terminal hydrolase n=2 Tax=Clytia hemisphaerica TaxID=252671 RepID=A0A7M5VFF9_9CNID